MSFFEKEASTINFIGATDIFDPPVPALKNIPEWYKKMSTNIGKLSINEEGNVGRTVKACMPVFDMTTAGYHILLPVDVLVIKENDNVQFQWAADNFEAVSNHSVQQYDQLKIYKEFYHQAFKFQNPWIIQTKPGYSCMFIQPSFRDDLPFEIFPGIVDTDQHPVPVNFPFLMRKGFEGIIPMGTPMVQVIPFKREKWSSNVQNISDTKMPNFAYAKRKILNRYKTFYRSAKVWK